MLRTSARGCIDSCERRPLTSACRPPYSSPCPTTSSRSNASTKPGASSTAASIARPFCPRRRRGARAGGARHPGRRRAHLRQGRASPEDRRVQDPRRAQQDRRRSRRPERAAGVITLLDRQPCPGRGAGRSRGRRPCRGHDAGRRGPLQGGRVSRLRRRGDPLRRARRRDVGAHGRGPGRARADVRASVRRPGIIAGQGTDRPGDPRRPARRGRRGGRASAAGRSAPGPRPRSRRRGPACASTASSPSRPTRCRWPSSAARSCGSSPSRSRTA